VPPPRLARAEIDPQRKTARGIEIRSRFDKLK